MTANIAQVKKQLAYKPFHPFRLYTTGGTPIYVQRAEWFHEVPEGPLYITEYGFITITWWRDLSETIEIEGPTSGERNQ